MHGATTTPCREDGVCKSLNLAYMYNMRLTSDKRPPIEQVKSGLRIVGAMVATVATVALFGLAYVEILNADHTRHSLTGWLLMIVLAIALGLTVQHWRRWFFFVPGYLGVRFSLWLLLGWFSPRGFVLVVFSLLMLAMAAMSFRFRESAKARAFDRATLLVTAACLLAAMLGFFSQGPSATALIFATGGDLILFTSLFYPTCKSRRRATHTPAPLTPNH